MHKVAVVRKHSSLHPRRVKGRPKQCGKNLRHRLPVDLAMQTSPSRHLQVSQPQTDKRLHLRLLSKAVRTVQMANTEKCRLQSCL